MGNENVTVNTAEGEYLVSVGRRLREERERLALSQPALAGHGGTTKKTQIDYEKGVSGPKAEYLARVAEIGVDVQYVITGVRSSMALAPDERLLMERYRASPAALRDAALRVLLGGGEPPPTKKVKISRSAGRDYHEHQGATPTKGRKRNEDQ